MHKISRDNIVSNSKRRHDDNLVKKYTNILKNVPLGSLASQVIDIIHNVSLVNKNPCMLICGAIYYVRCDHTLEVDEGLLDEIYDIGIKHMFHMDKEFKKLLVRPSQPTKQRILNDIILNYRYVQSIYSTKLGTSVSYVAHQEILEEYGLNNNDDSNGSDTDESEVVDLDEFVNHDSDDEY